MLMSGAVFVAPVGLSANFTTGDEVTGLSAGFEAGGEITLEVSSVCLRMTSSSSSIVRSSTTGLS